MKINQVEELVGITKKNIRFYEERELIHPERDPRNGYREYTLKDVEELQRVKLLRMLNVPITEIRKLQEGQITLEQCLEGQMIELQHTKHNLDITKQMCQKIMDAEEDLYQMDVLEYLSDMKRLEEGGVIFVDVKKQDVRTKKYGSVIAAIVSTTFILMIIAFLIYAEMEDPIPIGIFLFMLLMSILVIAGIAMALKQRLTEINGGEEDEASKY